MALVSGTRNQGFDSPRPNQNIYYMLTFRDFVLVVESFSDATRKFIGDGGSEKDVAKALVDFKLAKSLSLISNKNETDIGYWIKRGWISFRQFIDTINTAKKTKEIHSVAERDIFPVFENEFVRVFIPQTVEAARKYGFGTKWCIAAESNNEYNDYVFTRGLTPNYVIMKPKLVNDPLLKSANLLKMCAMVDATGEIDSVWDARDQHIGLDMGYVIHDTATGPTLTGVMVPWQRPAGEFISLRDFLAKFGLMDETFITRLKKTGDGQYAWMK